MLLVVVGYDVEECSMVLRSQTALFRQTPNRERNTKTQKQKVQRKILTRSRRHHVLHPLTKNTRQVEGNSRESTLGRVMKDLLDENREKLMAETIRPSNPRMAVIMRDVYSFTHL